MASETGASSKGALWAGRIMTALPAAMLTVSGVMKLARPTPVIDGFAELGYPESLLLILGIVELACVAIYMVPQTAVLGAILLTGYLGGATATHVRVEDPMFVAPIILGVLVWGGLFLRDSRVRDLIPLRK